MKIELQILNSGDSALFCSLGKEVSPDINIAVYAMEKFLLDKSVNGLIELVPSYSGLMVYYDPLVIDRSSLCTIIMQFSGFYDKERAETDLGTITIPVLYGKEHGPDLQFVAEINNLSIDEVITIHTSGLYRIYMLGFTPGFPYLGGMDSRIATPRKLEPRLKIPAGSVGIAGNQTGIYPIESPGGWQIIGQTPVLLFNPQQKNPFLAEPGLSLRFRKIDYEEYVSINRLITLNQYQPEINRADK